MSLSTPDQSFAAVTEDVPLPDTHFRLFRDLIYKQTGISLADNKLEFVQSRLRKRLRHHDLSSYKQYYDLLENDDPSGVEMQQMINRITTNKTHFFRERHHFEYLRDTVFAKLINEAKQGLRPRKLRIWCAAASTGEEPYTLAMTVRDSFAKHPGWDIRILSSDIDTNVLELAQQARYANHKVEDLPAEIRVKHFEKLGDEVRVRPETAELVTFRQVNLLEPNWPIRTQFDAIFCRNVLIYFDQETQNTLMRRMAQYLQSDGYLFIGHSESLSSINDTYKRVGKTVYQHVNAPPDHSSAHHVGPTMATVPHATVVATPPSPHMNPASAAPQTPVPPTRPVYPQVPPAAPLERARIVVGDVRASTEPLEISTVLGSCIAVCLFDTQNRIGGMNHFALPTVFKSERAVASFGVHAMELLINEIMMLGGDRRYFQAKVFGGANVLNLSDKGNVGKRNAAFIREFLENESIPILAEYLGGERGMQVLFETHTGRARMKLLDQSSTAKVDQEAASQQAAPPQPQADITLF